MGMLRRYRIDLALFGGMLALLWILATLFRIDATHASYAPHFVAQAQSWLRGQWDVPAALGHDLVRVGDRRFIVYPPLPALLMLPFVALLGGHFSDIWFTWLTGATNVVLIFRMLEAARLTGIAPRTVRENVVMAATFGVGTIALWLALGGTVWFTAQTLAITCMAGMILAALHRNWWAASLALGALFLTRSPDLLAGIFLLGILQHDGMLTLRHADLWRAWRALLPALALPLAAALAIWLARNQIAFGHLWSSGYDLQIQQDYPQIQHGLLSWHYVWPNVVVDFLNPPSFSFSSPFDLAPSVDLLRGGNGTSIFFTTPLVALLFAPGPRSRYGWMQGLCWLCAGALIVFSLFWNLTGWYQAGARYLFDAYPFLWLLLAMRAAPLGWRWLALAGAGVMVNLALANAFWCQNGACMGTSIGTRWLAFLALIAMVPLACLAIWRWLHAPSPVAAMHEAVSPEE